MNHASSSENATSSEPVTTQLGDAQIAAVTMLLSAGKTIRDIAKFAELDPEAITHVARTLDREPDTAAQRRGKELFRSADALTFQRVAKQLAAEGHTADDGEPMHHLTVASWVRNYGWAWGGASDGDYAPKHATNSVRSRYVLRLSKSMDAEINSPEAIKATVEAAWHELSTDRTRVVQVAIIRAAARTGATDLSAIKKQLLATYGDEIRTARD